MSCLTRSITAVRQPGTPHLPRLRPLARALLTAGALGAAASLHAETAALPSGLQVVRGQASTTLQGNALTVRNSPGAILNWQTFSIGAAGQVHFDQANASSKVLNRVVGSDPSSILGQLTSNGQVWLLNPNGVLFGQGSRVDVAGLVASTLRMTDSDFIAGRYRLSAAGAAPAEAVRNEGSLHGSFGGQIVLVGGSVDNRGEVVAPGGQVSLVAARRVELVDTGLPNLVVRVDVPAGDLDGEVLNRGTLAAPGGRVDVYAGIVNQEGLISAESLSVGREGQIVLHAADTLMLGDRSRTLAEGRAAGAPGGRIDLLGPQVGLAGDARVSASGESGGGIVRVGGGFRGQDPEVPNARSVYFGENAAVLADTLGEQGNGGSIVLWSDQATRAYGSISARGGLNGGHGGTVEVSAKDYLDFGARVGLVAPKGYSGTLLLDPDNIVIDNGAASTPPLAAQIQFGGSGTTSFTNGTLNTMLAAANVELQANVGIRLNAGADVVGVNRLTLRAGDSIDLNSNVSAAGGIVLSANDPGGLRNAVGRVSLQGNLDAGSSAVLITNNGGTGTHLFGRDISAGTLAVDGNIALSGASSTLTLTAGDSTVASSISGSGALVKRGSATLVLTGASTYGGGTTIEAGRLAVSGTNAAAGTGLITIGSAAQLDIIEGAVVNNDILARNGSAIIKSTGALATLGSVGSLVIEDGGTLTLGTPVSTENSPLVMGRAIQETPGGAAESVTIKGYLNFVPNLVHTYAGGTTVDGGTIFIGGASAQLGTGAINLVNFGIVYLTGMNLTNPLSVSSGQIHDFQASSTVSGPITVAGTLTFGSDVVGGTGLQISSSISGPGGVSVLGGFDPYRAPITFTGANSYAGPTTIEGSASAPRVVNFEAGSLPTASPLVVQSFGMLNLLGSNTVASATIAGTLTTTSSLLSAASYTLNDGAVINAPMGAGTLRSNGAVALNATSAASSVSVDSGTLTLGSPGRLSGGADVVVAQSAALQFGGNEAVNSLALQGGTLGGVGVLSAGTLSLSGGVVGINLGTGTLVINSDTLLSGTSAAGAVLVNGGTLTTGAASRFTAAPALTIANTATLRLADSEVASTVAGSGVLRLDSGALTVGSGADSTFAGTVIGSGGISKVGSGTFTLAGSAAHTGTTQVSSGVLRFTGTAGLGAVQVNDSVIDFSGSSATLGSLDLAGGTLSGTAPVSVTGSFDMTSRPSTLTGTGVLTTRGVTTLNLASASGGIVSVAKPWVNAGTFTLGGDDAVTLGAGGSLTNGAGGTLNLTSSSAVPLSGGAGTTFGNAGTLIANAGGARTIAVGSISNSGSISLTAGTLGLSAGFTANEGAITIAAGTTLGTAASFVNNASGSLSGAGTLAVAAGSGTLTNQGRITPAGSGTGLLAINGNLVQLSGGTLQLDVGGTAAGLSDRLAVSGNITLGGALNASLVGGYTPVNADFVSILSSGGASSGAFSEVRVPGGFLVRYNSAAGEAARLSFVPANIFTNPAGTADASSIATAVALTTSMHAVAVAAQTSTPTEGRVLDAVPAFGAAEGSGRAFRGINIGTMTRDELQSLLAARAGVKKKLFADGLFRLEQSPELADVRPCRTEREIDSGLCLVTEALKREVQAARDAARLAAVQQASGSKRRMTQAALPTIERKLALLIGINDYRDKNVPKLEGAVPDARAVAALLEERLGYEAQVLENPSKEQIVRAMNALALEAKPSDSVIIYYAGHGVVLEKDGQGYWLPADIDVERPEGWLSNADIGRLVALIGARQMMLVSDSCFSGTLVGGGERVRVAGGDPLSLLSRRAAVIMSSGGDEPVADEGRDGHSVFAWHFMEELRDVDGWRTGSDVFERLRDAVSREFPQTPQYGASRFGGHEGNTDYLYERRTFDRARP